MATKNEKIKALFEIVIDSSTLFPEIDGFQIFNLFVETLKDKFPESASVQKFERVVSKHIDPKTGLPIKLEYYGSLMLDSYEQLAMFKQFYTMTIKKFVDKFSCSFKFTGSELDDLSF